MNDKSESLRFFFVSAVCYYQKNPYKREDAGYLSIPGYYYEKVISKANREKLFTGVRLPLAINL